MQNFYFYNLARKKVYFFLAFCTLLFSTNKHLSAQQVDGKDRTEKVETFDATIALKWNHLYLEIERHAVRYYRPPQSARIVAYIGIATYEGLVTGMPNHNSLNFEGLQCPKMQKDKQYYYPAVYNAIYANMLRRFFPIDPVPIIDDNAWEMINKMENVWRDSFINVVGTNTVENSEQYGQQIAKAVFEWAATDIVGHNSFRNPMDYTYHLSLPQKPGIYYDHSLSPNWGKCRLFAAKQADIDAGIEPLPYSEDKDSEIYKQSLEVALLVDSIRQGKNYEAQWQAHFWSDDIPGITFTPPARYISILNQALKITNDKLDKAVEAYAKLGIGLNDAVVVCWALKYKWNVERPITYINRVIDKDWQTIMGTDIYGDGIGLTPKFPAYPSGHSFFGGVGAEILTDLFGDNFEMTDNTHKKRRDIMAMPRRFKNFKQMGEENAYSRIAIGVHFRMDCDEGLRLGYLVGKRVLDLKWKKTP